MSDESTPKEEFGSQHEGNGKPRRKRFGATLKSAEIEVELQGNEGRGTGEYEVLSLVEMDGLKRGKWDQAYRDRFDGGESMKEVNGLEIDLITRCAYEPDGNLIKANKVSKWPASTIEAVFKECLEVNSMTKAAQEAAKKA